jgi:hypothetical protein
MPNLHFEDAEVAVLPAKLVLIWSQRKRSSSSRSNMTRYRATLMRRLRRAQFLEG